MTGPTPTTPDRIRVADRVLDVARADPDRVAMVQTDSGRDGVLIHRKRTYGELSDRAERLAEGLRATGIREGTLCSFMVPPSFNALVLGTALFRVGATLVGIEPYSHGMRRVRQCLDRIGPEVFFGTPRAHLAKRLFGWGRRTVRQEFVVDGAWPGVRSMDDLLSDRAPDVPEPADVEPGDPAVIAFTTGSTGKPKPTVLRQRNFAAMVELVGAQWALGDGGDVIDMPTFPMFWIIALSAGGQVVVPPMDFTMKGPGDADPAALLRTIEERGVRSMFGSPALLRNLSAHARRESITVESVRRIVAGGAEVQGPLYAAVRDMLGPEGELYSNYGATEALPLCEISGTTVLEETWERTERGEGLCVGPGLPGVELRIVPVTEGNIADIGDVEALPAGEVGEVIARSPHISEDYFQDPVATAANKVPDPDGTVWHRLGDVGHLDDQGRLWLGGRRSHRVITRGGIFLPLRVEPVLATHPAVHRAALVGVPRAGSIAAVVCVERSDEDRRDSATVAAELRALAERNESTRGLTEFVEVRRLPVDRRHNAKIDRPALGASLARRRKR
ncbi:fatty acid CoA ligase family protein [Nocardiopsis sp. NPDC006832]|uniref:fatty acid CoA ligase family protein n=1 Tax=Nocardiopsis sp. NPDC006832 TaxID=3157188 RepID=UPI0033DF61F3